MERRGKGYKVESKNASADSQDENEMSDGNKVEEDEYLVMFVWL
jgi:hypothetical protein